MLVLANEMFNSPPVFAWVLPEMGQPGTQCATELSGNGTPLWHATKPEAKNHHRGIAEGWSWDPYSTSETHTALTR